MRLLVVLQVQLLAAVSASQLDLSLGSLEQPPEGLCARGATAANLGANKLSAVPPCCPSFRALQVHRNHIQELPEDWLQHCPHLEELSVSGNKLGRLPPRLLGSSSSLRRLQASRNLLYTLPAQLLTNATSLTELDLSHNQLSELPPGFLDTNTRLEELYLQGNLLVSLGERVLATCPRLRRLRLSGNRLSRLPEALLASAHRLTTLRLDRNQLAAVDAAAFRNNKQLLLVDLSSNKLTSLPPGLFANAESLRYLLLRGNQLRTPPAAGSLPGQPISLDLRDNRLPTVDDFAAFGESRVWLDGNRWRCDCSLAPVLREAASARQPLWFQQRPMCYHGDGDRDRHSFSQVGLPDCQNSSAATAATRDYTLTAVPKSSNGSYSDTVPTTATSGAAGWSPGDNKSVTASSATENSVSDTPKVTTHETSPLLFGSTESGVSDTSDIETTTSDVGSTEAGTPVSYISETTTSRIASTENDTLTTPYRETTTPQIGNSDSDFLETSEAGTSEIASTATDDSAAETTTLRIASSENGDSSSLTPLAYSPEPYHVPGTDNEAIQGFGPVTYSTTTDVVNNNSATTDLTDASSVATTSEVNTSETDEPQTNETETATFLTSNPTVHSDVNDLYDELPMY